MAASRERFWPDELVPASYGRRLHQFGDNTPSGAFVLPFVSDLCRFRFRGEHVVSPSGLFGDFTSRLRQATGRPWNALIKAEIASRRTERNAFFFTHRRHGGRMIRRLPRGHDVYYFLLPFIRKLCMAFPGSESPNQLSRGTRDTPQQRPMPRKTFAMCPD